MIDLIESEEQQQIVDSIRRFLADSLPVSRLQKGSTETDHAVWRQLAEFGVFGISAAEELGGIGLSLADEALVFREIGRAAGTPSFAATWLALQAATKSGDDDTAKAIVGGDHRAAMILPGKGKDVYVLDPAGAKSAVLWANGELCVFDIDGDKAKRIDALDWTLPAATLPASDLVSPRYDPVPIGELEGFDIICAAMSAGLAEAARDRAVDYAGVREQFGKPIGSFQAIKHQCSDTEVRCMAAWTQTLYAALSIDAGDPGAEFNRRSARVIATDAAIDNAETCIHVHGGFGFTAECDAHVLLKRACTVARLGEPTDLQLDALLEMESPGPIKPEHGVPAGLYQGR